MKNSLIFLLVIGLVVAAEPCISCGELSSAPEARLFTTIDQDAIQVTAFYENLSADPSRVPIANYILLLEVADETGDQLEFYRIYTDSDGNAQYNFSSLSEQCLTFKVLYCPFCDPDSPACGFEACLNYSGIETDAEVANDVPVAPGETIPGSLNEQRFLPALAQNSYCPPPPPLGATPSMCFPLLLIFSLLAGSMYITGRNPFAGFNLGGARIGRHIRYQARGRGYSFSTMAAASALISVGTAAKTLKESGGKGLADIEKRSARGRFLGGGLMQVGRGVSALSAARTSSKGKKDRGQSIARSMEAQTNVWRQDKGSGKEKAASGSSTLTGSGMAFLPGGGAVRSGEIVQTGSGFWGNVFGTMGRMVLIIASQSTVGRVADGFMYLGNRKGMLDRLGVTDHEQRMASDLQVASEMMDEKMEGIRVNVNGQEMIVTRAAFDAEGNMVYTIASPAKGGGTMTRTVTINENGKVVGISYEMTLSAEQARQIPGYEAGQKVNVSLNDRGVAVISDASGSQHPQEQFVLNSKTDQELVGTFRQYQEGITGFTIGANASKFQDTYNANQKALASVVASAGMEASIAMMHSGNDLNDLLAANPESRHIVVGLRSQMANEDIGILVDPAGVESGTSDTSEYVEGLSPRKSKYGTRTQSEEAVIRIGEAHGDSAFADREGFTQSITSASGLKEAKAGLLVDGVHSVVRESSAGELEGMSQVQLRTQVRENMVDNLVRQGMPAHLAEQKADTVLASANMDAVTRQVNQAGQGLVQNFQAQGFNDAMVAKLKSTDVGEIGRLAQTGVMMQDDNAARVVSQSPTSYQHNEETRRSIDQYRILEHAMNNIQELQQAIGAGDFARAAMEQQQSRESIDLYWHAKANAAVSKDPELPDERAEVVVERQKVNYTILEEAETGTEMAFRGTKMMHATQQPGMGNAIQENIKRENETRDTIMDNIEHGNFDAAKQMASDMAHYHYDRGNTAAGDAYLKLGVHLDAPPDKPTESFAQNAESILDQAPRPEYLAPRTVAVQQQAAAEQQVTQQVLGSMQEGDYSTAKATAIQRYKYHKEQGNEQQAQAWLGVVQQTHEAQALKPTEANKERSYEATREALGIPEQQPPPKPPANFESLPPEKKQKFTQNFMEYQAAQQQQAEERNRTLLGQASSTYDRTVQIAGEGYGHIIDAADRAGKYMKADDES